MEDEKALIVLLLLIVLISAVQFVQLAAINNNLVLAQYKGTSGASGLSVFQNVPNMVGGC